MNPEQMKAYQEVRKTLIERLQRWEFTGLSDQLEKLSAFQLVSLLNLTAGHVNYMPTFTIAVRTLEELFGEIIYKKPDEEQPKIIEPKPIEKASTEDEPCKRPSGTVRAHFRTREEAEAFARDPANHPAYLGDIAHECRVCGFWHLSRFEWLFPEWKLRGKATMN